MSDVGLREQIIGQLADTPHVEPHRAVASAEDLMRRYDAERERKLRGEIAAEIRAAASEHYPDDIFPVMAADDWVAIKALLEADGRTLDRVSANLMRRGMRVAALLLLLDEEGGE